MHDILNQIEKALDVNLYYLALFGALAIPDICGAVDSADGTASKVKYIDWYTKYASNSCPFLNGEDCYYFRCSFLHQGSTQHSKSNYSRILFVEPGNTGAVFHCNVMNDALNIDVNIFCRDLVAAARAWLKSVEGTKNYNDNMQKFIQRYPTGLAPFIGDIPVIG